MKTLFLLRHGKSEWPEGIEDEERPLSRKGTDDLILLSEYLKQRKIKFDHVHVSSALRTRETFLVLKKKKVKVKDILFTAMLYEKSGEEMLQYVKEKDNNTDCVMLIGHNPGLEELAQMLTGNANFSKFPTSAFLQIEFDTDQWAECQNGKIRLFWIP